MAKIIHNNLKSLQKFSVWLGCRSRLFVRDCAGKRIDCKVFSLPTTMDVVVRGVNFCFFFGDDRMARSVSCLIRK